jgi:hypothetical protein
MSPGRSFFLLTGIALLGTIASFNQLASDARASFLDATGETAPRTAQAQQQRTVATYRALTDEVADATALERPVHVLAPAPVERRESGEPRSQLMGARSNEEAPALAGNPLWALPLEQLSTTRERPIFSPSRRPPPSPPTHVAAVVIRQPVKQPEPERPGVSLIGTVTSAQVRMGVFLETATQNVFRLRLGEDHQGWALRLVKAREVTLVKDIEQEVVLELTPPGAAPGPRVQTVVPPVPNSIGTIPVLNTANYVDEQPLPARGARGQGH